jgi:large repetitive protein
VPCHVFTSPRARAWLHRSAPVAAALGVALLSLWLTVARPTEAAAAPSLTGVAPALGTRGGGTVLALTGTGFLAGATVTIGGAPAVGVVVNSANSITATTPAGTPGNALIVVTNTDGQSTTLSGAFTYQEWPPTVGGVVPIAGGSLGGTSITISGTGFLAGATARIGGTPATSVVVVNATTITAVTPPHTAGLVDVVVTNIDTQSGTLPGSFTYNAAPSPTVTSASPTTGTTGGGTAVTITGTNFASGATVTFGGTAASSVQFVSATQLVATTPARAAGPAAIIVANLDTQTGTLLAGFTYVAMPAPVVTITGTGFLTGATVTIGGTPATGVNVVSPTSITATAPAKSTAGAVSVEVKNTDLQTGTLASGYAYVDKPTVTTLTPSTGPAGGGTVLKIAGSNFGTAPTVKFGSATATGVTVSSATELTVTAPAGTGIVDVTVTGPRHLRHSAGGPRGRRHRRHDHGNGLHHGRHGALR